VSDITFVCLVVFCFFVLNYIIMLQNHIVLPGIQKDYCKCCDYTYSPYIVHIHRTINITHLNYHSLKE